MAWQTLISAAVLAQFTPDETATLQSTQGAVDNLPDIVALVIAEVRDCIRAGGYALDADSGKLPLGLHNDAISIARWRWLISIPQCAALQTEPRKAAADAAMAKLERISSQRFSVEPPEAGGALPSGSWNSENKLVMRTHPVPTPATQFPPETAHYANPDAVPDDG